MFAAVIHKDADHTRTPFLLFIKTGTAVLVAPGTYASIVSQNYGARFLSTAVVVFVLFPRVAQMATFHASLLKKAKEPGSLTPWNASFWFSLVQS